MSIGTTTKDCDGPPYPQWGEARRVDTKDIDSDSDTGAVDSNAEEPLRGDGTPEQWGPDAGATTAEYAITTLAACGFAALLVVILKSEPIKELVTGVIQTALGLGA
ncbi:MAG: DUF4244 domain-containing protein [Brevibacterium aurantiacum]|uniref:DUF4244 domain-containing protein n=1 Tax=Brevibacterium aurantiacum TaxID=273384 RepID=A0A1D7W0R3_BREAU|nr:MULTISPECIES: DUF4244 domain-containing protein [Brevibacterium]MDN5549142.1 DUF4244 domain-containing protein [Brevibacterium sp.]AOP52659.1 hypothetical protein BLSMQ_0947 [Brevibacterium aurantiacum]AZL04983.1 DUF4244 domain-containing protein [Brevibacterium aurantiacum]AZL08572.1 DUF4244 domain-containing protein [Brevibacterium aurantiacum]AZL12181.1 DUF4244 domain-containing protein [Brevibacterium aurantiacum]